MAEVSFMPKTAESSEDLMYAEHNHGQESVPEMCRNLWLARREARVKRL